MNRIHHGALRTWHYQKSGLFSLGQLGVEKQENSFFSEGAKKNHPGGSHTQPLMTVRKFWQWLQSQVCHFVRLFTFTRPSVTESQNRVFFHKKKGLIDPYHWFHRINQKPGSPPLPEAQPQVLCHGIRTSKVIIFGHGLTDSPGIVREVADEFFRLGFNVILPLYPGHGSKNPRDIHLTSFDDWKAEFQRYLPLAKTLGTNDAKISVGGYSLGGLLAVTTALEKPSWVNGSVFLFAPALGLYRKAQERCLRNPFVFHFASFLARIFFRKSRIESVGGDPRRYQGVSYRSARKVNQGIQQLLSRYGFGKKFLSDLSLPIFCVHSLADTSISTERVEAIRQNHTNPDAVDLVTIPKHLGTSHSAIVHRKLGFENGNNPQFQLLSERMEKFVKKNELTKNKT